MEKTFDRAILVGYAIYRTANGTKAKRDFSLGSVEQMAVGCLDLEKVATAIREKYEIFVMNKAKKSQYKLIGMELRLWTSGNTYRYFNLKVSA